MHQQQRPTASHSDSDTTGSATTNKSPTGFRHKGFSFHGIVPLPYTQALLSARLNKDHQKRGSRWLASRLFPEFEFEITFGRLNVTNSATASGRHTRAQCCALSQRATWTVAQPIRTLWSGRLETNIVVVQGSKLTIWAGPNSERKSDNLIGSCDWLQRIYVYSKQIIILTENENFPL